MCDPDTYTSILFHAIQQPYLVPVTCEVLGLAGDSEAVTAESGEMGEMTVLELASFLIKAHLKKPGMMHQFNGLALSPADPTRRRSFPKKQVYGQVQV